MYYCNLYIMIRHTFHKWVSREVIEFNIVYKNIANCRRGGMNSCKKLNYAVETIGGQ